MIRSKRLRLSTSLAVTLGFASFVALPARAADKVTISQAFQSMLYLPFYVAMDGGFFAGEGVEVTKETAGAPAVALSAVISKSAQYSIHGPEWTAIAASKGAPVNVVANVVNGAAVWIATTPDVTFNDVKDLKGQKIVTGLMPTTSTSLFLKLLKENGLKPEDVEMTQVQLGSEPGPLLAGQAKIAVMYEPGLDQVVAKGMKVVLGFPERYGPYAFSAVSARKDVDPAVTQKVVTGLQKAIRFMHAEPEKTVAIAKKQFPNLDPAVVEAAVKRMMREKVYPDSVDITAEALKTGMETQVALGNLSGLPDYATFVRRDFIEKSLAAN